MTPDAQRFDAALPQPTPLSGAAMKDEVAVRLEEYKTLRTEIIESIKTQAGVLTFGTAGVGLLGNVAFRRVTHQLFVPVVSMIGLPLLCLLVVTIWMNEVMRMLRAGLYLVGVEASLNKMAPGAGMGWESDAHQRDQPDVERTQFVLLALFYGVIALIGMAWGLYHTCQSWVSTPVRTLLCIGAGALLAGGILALVRLSRAYREMRRRWHAIWPTQVRRGKETEFYYSGDLARDATALTLHWRVEGESEQQATMSKGERGSWTTRITVPPRGKKLTLTIRDQTGLEDDRCRGYTLPVHRWRGG